MTDYKKLVEALRHCVSDEKGVTKCAGCPYYPDITGCMDRLHTDAAAAIEALQAEVGQWKAAVKGQEDGIKVLQAEVERLEPKRGEWVPYEFNTNGTWHKCSVCGVAYQYKDAPNSGWWINHKYCPNCGAKMEVQDG